MLLSTPLDKVEAITPIGGGARVLAVESAHRGGTLVQLPISVRTATFEDRRLPRCVCPAHARIVGARGATRPAFGEQGVS
jgi:hypothetical protein